MYLDHRNYQNLYYLNGNHSKKKESKNNLKDKNIVTLSISNRTPAKSIRKKILQKSSSPNVMSAISRTPVITKPVRRHDFKKIYNYLNIIMRYVNNNSSFGFKVKTPMSAKYNTLIMEFTRTEANTTIVKNLLPDSKDLLKLFLTLIK